MNIIPTDRAYPKSTVYDDLERLRFMRRWCESPIESRFITSLIASHRFVVMGQEGARECKLEGRDIAVVPQYKIGRYRLDFAFFFYDINGRHHSINIECDGKEFHSSPEAIERDRKRDQYMREQGFDVWRYPGWALHHGDGACADEAEQAIISLKNGGSPIFVFCSNKRKANPGLPEMEAAYLAFQSNGVWPQGFGPNPDQRGWDHISDLYEDFEDESEW
jgi:very-short-patch-repair endonuclease